jgi:hypothetical protein
MFVTPVRTEFNPVRTEFQTCTLAVSIVRPIIGPTAPSAKSNPELSILGGSTYSGNSPLNPERHIRPLVALTVPVRAIDWDNVRVEAAVTLPVPTSDPVPAAPSTASPPNPDAAPITAPITVLEKPFKMLHPSYSSG